MWWIAYLWWLIPHIHLILSVFIRDQGQFSSLPTPPTSPPILMQPNHSTACPVIDSLNLYLTHHILTHLVLWTWFSLFTPKLRSIVLPLMWTLGTWTAFFSNYVLAHYFIYTDFFSALFWNLLNSAAAAFTCIHSIIHMHGEQGYIGTFTLCCFMMCDLGSVRLKICKIKDLTCP